MWSWEAELDAEYDGYSNDVQRTHATALTLGLSCPYDCAACDPEYRALAEMVHAASDKPAAPAVLVAGTDVDEPPF